MSGMSFFAGSSGFTINGGAFNIFNATTPPKTVRGKRKERDSSEPVVDKLRKKPRRGRRNSDGLTIMRREEVDLGTELVSGTSYHIHSASHEGSVVAVKVFGGSHAKQDWTADIALSKKLFHPNIPKMVGVSEECSKTPFIVFRGISGKTMPSLIANALHTNLSKSVQLSMKAVRGIAAGLSYMQSQKSSLDSGTMISTRRWEDFEILAGENNEPIITIGLPKSLNEGDSRLQSFSIENNGFGVEVLNRLCQKLFFEANSILYNDSPEREFDVFDEGFATITHLDLTESETSSSPPNSTGNPKLSQTPRREVLWREADSNNNSSLDMIARHFGNRLDCFLSSSCKSPLRRIRGSTHGYLRRTSHKCPGYVREEITLSTDVSRSAIVSHEDPNEREICTVCGKLVEYGELKENWDPTSPGSKFIDFYESEADNKHDRNLIWMVHKLNL